MFCGFLTGWGNRDPVTHHIEGNKTRFPEGMPAFIAKIHAMGFKFGLYTDIGTMGCHHPFVGSWPHYQQDANDFASWEVDYVKFDGCDQPSGPNIGNRSVLTCNMSQALAHTGRDMWLNFHCWHDDKCAECGNSYRVDHDHHDQWSNTASVIDFLATSRQPFWGANPTRGWPDPDFVFTGGQGCGAHSAAGVRCPGQTDDEYVSEFSVWAVAGGQIVIASDPRNMTAFQKRVWFNEEVLAVYKDTSHFGEIAMVPDTTLSGGGILPAAVEPAAAAAASCTVKLTAQISGAACIEGKTFGCNADLKTMWTSHGCRGTFTCNGVAEVDCEDWHYPHPKVQTCACAAPPPAPAQVWGRPLADGSVAVVLHNPNEKTQTVTASFATLPGGHGWTDKTTLHVRDLWAGKDLDDATGSFATSVNAHGAAFLKLTAAS